MIPSLRVGERHPSHFEQVLKCCSGRRVPWRTVAMDEAVHRLALHCLRSTPRCALKPRALSEADPAFCLGAESSAPSQILVAPRMLRGNARPVPPASRSWLSTPPPAPFCAVYSVRQTPTFPRVNYCLALPTPLSSATLSQPFPQLCGGDNPAGRLHLAALGDAPQGGCTLPGAHPTQPEAQGQLASRLCAPTPAGWGSRVWAGRLLSAGGVRSLALKPGGGR